MIRFLGDLDLNHAVATGLQRLEPEVDAVLGREVGLDAKGDDEVLYAQAFRHTLSRSARRGG